MWEWCRGRTLRGHRPAPVNVSAGHLSTVSRCAQVRSLAPAVMARMDHGAWRVPTMRRSARVVGRHPAASRESERRDMAEPELDPTRVRFDPLHGDDLPLLHTWLHTEHVAAWWRERPTYAEVVAEYTPCIAGETPAHCYLIMYEDAPIGYIQRYRLADEPDYARAVAAAENAAGVDLFIGEARYLHRGLGSAALRRFVREIV